MNMSSECENDLAEAFRIILCEDNGSEEFCDAVDKIRDFVYDLNTTDMKNLTHALAVDMICGLWNRTD